MLITVPYILQESSRDMKSERGQTNHVKSFPKVPASLLLHYAMIQT